MGIGSRLRQLFAANVNDLQDQKKDPKQWLDQHMAKMRSGIEQIQAQAAARKMQERRAGQELDECQENISKLKRYAEKSVEAGDDQAAKRFLEQKADQETKLPKLQAQYEQIASLNRTLQQIESKAGAELEQLQARSNELNVRMAEAQSQKTLQASYAMLEDEGSAMNRLKDQADLAFFEAEALRELREESDLDTLLAQLDEEDDSEQDR